MTGKREKTFLDRWFFLSKSQRRAVYFSIVKGQKCFAAAQSMGISRSRVTQLLTVTYIMLDLANSVALAFEVGRHWNDLEKEFGEFENEQIKNQQVPAPSR